MKIYNTLTKRIEEFKPITEGQVLMYTCGPTVYYFAHIGNLRTYIFEDTLQKTLEYIGYHVKRAMNITDVGHMSGDSDNGEDKMLLASNKEGKSVNEIATFYTEAFKKDCTRLNIKWPEIVEKASDHIDYYIFMIERLLEKGFAYISAGNVYFDVSKMPHYYQLSGKNQDELLVGVRDTVEEDKNKHHPADFGLWFTSSKFSNQLMQWDSPWGRGYPGWHIECSGLACQFLGERIDIHCGGVDNIFPHHTNEIAQSEAFLGHKWCNYWMHGEYLNDKSGKMSKSKGGILTLDDLIAKGFQPIHYRYFCLNSHYRKTLTFSFENLEGAKNAYQKLKNRVMSLKEEGLLNEEAIKKYQNAFQDAISDDLNTAQALTVLYDVLKSELNDNSKRYLISDFDKVLSLDLLKEEKLMIDDEIKKKIAQRDLAKKQKNFKEADAIRDELLKEGIVLIDTREGTVYKRRD